jgi:hypothetical protein
MPKRKRSILDEVQKAPKGYKTFETDLVSKKQAAKK